MEQVVEIRTYTLKEGMGERFHRVLHEQSLPLLRAAGADIVAAVPSRHAKDAYALIRAYEGLNHRRESQDAFYGSAAWLEGPEESVMACIASYTTLVIMADTALITALRNITRTR